jgi:hypothetical protein
MKGVLRSNKAPRRWIGGKKRCTKGKSCGASCINRKIICRLELGNVANSGLNRLRRIRRQSVMVAHPNLAKDYTEANVKMALREIASLDKDAGRRASVVMKLFEKTKTIFIDWKDDVTNRKLFVAATAKIHANPGQLFDNQAAKKTWGGVAFPRGSSMVKASPGFKPSVKQIKSLVEKQIKGLSQNEKLPFSMGKGTKALGNNPLVTLVHELGHHGHTAAKEMLLGDNLKLVSIYSEVNHKEHFAELFTAYMFAGPKLKALYPMEYEAVENVLSKANLL